MRLPGLPKPDPRLEARLRRIVALSRRRDRLLESPALDLDALARLAADYAAADMPCAAADLRRRLDWYRNRLGENREKKKPPPKN
jgi:hypothetical protein